MRLDEFVAHYTETALWAETDGDGTPLDDEKYSDAALAPEAKYQFQQDCSRFLIEYSKIVAGLDDAVLRLFPPESRIPHDFWLTRNRHGAGFWDGDYPKEVGEALTKLAHSFGECDLYVGDDGQIYCQ